MQHPKNRLTQLPIKRLGPARHADGGGLELLVKPSGSKRWLLRTVIDDKRRNLGLSSFSTTTLAEAREKALAMRKIARAAAIRMPRVR